MYVTPVSNELLERYNKPGPRYTSYPTVPVWKADFGEDDYRAALRDLAAQTNPTVSLYVHIPFCATRCYYCGCNATVTRREEVVDVYLDRVQHELEMVTESLGKGKRVVQLHWGGGTPNFLTNDQMERLFRMLDDHFAIDRDGELAIEIDPRIGTREQIGFLKQLGFNRISLGVQDFDDFVQEAIGRIQPIDLTREQYYVSRELGFESVNLDMVYGLPFQTAETFEITLQEVINLKPDRIACFSYAHVPWVKSNQKRIDTSKLPDTNTKFQLFQTAIAAFTEAGYDWIGMDHFAQHDDEMAVAVRERRLHRNFMGYTTRPALHMIALGMSGISDLAGRFVQNDHKLGSYQKTLDSGHLPVVRGYHLNEDDRIRRLAITHLMCNLELPFDLTKAEFGVRLDEVAGESLERLEAYIDEGFVEFTPDRLIVTPLGRYFVRNLAMELDAHLEKNSDRPIFSKTI